MSITKEDVERYSPKLELTRHTGALLWFFQSTYSYRGKPDELKPELVSVTIKNLVFGWWSPRSIIINPVVTITNLYKFRRYAKAFDSFMAAPEKYLIDAKEAAYLKLEKQKRHTKRLLIILGILVAIFVTVIIAGVTSSN